MSTTRVAPRGIIERANLLADDVTDERAVAEAIHLEPAERLRQLICDAGGHCDGCESHEDLCARATLALQDMEVESTDTVSYTHLTLPTKA